jgi:hypothetical protein
LNIHGFNDVRETELHTAEPLLPEPSAFELELAIENKKPKSPRVDQIPAELFKAECRTVRCEIYKLIFSFLNKEKLPKEWKESIIVTTYEKGDKPYCSHYRGISICQIRTKFYQTSCFLC